MLPRRIGQEVVLLNNVDIAAILADEFAGRLREAARRPAAVVPRHDHQRTEEPAGREGRLRREVPKETITKEFQKIKLVDTIPGQPGAGGSSSNCFASRGPPTSLTGRMRGEAGCRASSSSENRTRHPSMSRW